MFNPRLTVSPCVSDRTQPGPTPRVLSQLFTVFPHQFRYPTRVPDASCQHPTVFKTGVPWRVYRGNPINNRILNAIPDGEFERLRPHLELVTHTYHQSLHESAEEIEHATFP